MPKAAYNEFWVLMFIKPRLLYFFNDSCWFGSMAGQSILLLLLCTVAVCSLVGKMQRMLLAWRAYHQCWRVRVQFPTGTWIFSSSMWSWIAGRLSGVSPGTLVCSPSLSCLLNKKMIPNSVIAELALHTTWLSLCWCNRVHTDFERQNSRTFEGLSMSIFFLFKDLNKMEKVNTPRSGVLRI